jgi:hypothetical protein
MDANLTFQLVEYAEGAVITGAIALLAHAHITQKTLQKAEDIAHTAMNAVEQIAPALKIKGSAKLGHAIDMAKGLAKDLGVNLSDTQWETLIEHAVSVFNQSIGKLPAQ